MFRAKSAGQPTPPPAPPVREPGGSGDVRPGGPELRYGPSGLEGRRPSETEGSGLDDGYLSRLYGPGARESAQPSPEPPPAAPVPEPPPPAPSGPSEYTRVIKGASRPPTPPQSSTPPPPPAPPSSSASGGRPWLYLVLLGVVIVVTVGLVLVFALTGGDSGSGSGAGAEDAPSSEVSPPPGGGG
ncbi:MAG: hypothetical protein PVJ02_09675 [Gemmatimonadota bacterium]|jgi:hypothetical protein